jgi:hypothetical protein
MLENLFGVQYTGTLDGNVYGYHVVATDGGYEAIVHLITTTGRAHLGQCDVSHCHTVADQADAVRSFMDRWIYS